MGGDVVDPDEAASFRKLVRIGIAGPGPGPGRRGRAEVDGAFAQPRYDHAPARSLRAEIINRAEMAHYFDVTRHLSVEEIAERRRNQIRCRARDIIAKRHRGLRRRG